MREPFSLIEEDVRNVAGTLSQGAVVTLLYKQEIGGRWVTVEVKVRA